MPNARFSVPVFTVPGSRIYRAATSSGIGRPRRLGFLVPVLTVPEHDFQPAPSACHFRAAPDARHFRAAPSACHFLTSIFQAGHRVRIDKCGCPGVEYI